MQVDAYVLRIYVVGEVRPRAQVRGEKTKLENVIDTASREGGVWFGNEFVPMHRIHRATVE